MWQHDTLKSCKIQIGNGHIELDEQGVVVSPSEYALKVLQRYGNVTGFSPIKAQEPVTQDTVSEDAVASDEAKPKRRRVTRKSATK
jgi:hypothetical protein